MNKTTHRNGNASGRQYALMVEILLIVAVIPAVVHGVLSLNALSLVA